MAFKFDIEPLFISKGVSNKLKFLRSNGFRYTEAQQLAYKNPKAIKFEQIHKLCLAFKCTPNDLFSIDEQDTSSLSPDHPLKSLIREPLPNIPSLLKNLSMEKITELSRQIISFTENKTK